MQQRKHQTSAFHYSIIFLVKVLISNEGAFFWNWDNTKVISIGETEAPLVKKQEQLQPSTTQSSRSMPGTMSELD
uniref:Uncharacterized protein n=1 Tax=Nelumbo nucifera TaxID=4432 RepID=A0A822XVW2_NELNU|nr:TPA_asm: hypothetical protein HUJ06_023031 [Nelumbo nucifera]